MLRLKEVASQSQTFPKRALEKQNVNRTLLLPRPATGRTLQLFSIDRPPLLAVWREWRGGDHLPHHPPRSAKHQYKSTGFRSMGVRWKPPSPHYQKISVSF